MRSAAPRPLPPGREGRGSGAAADPRYRCRLGEAVPGDLTRNPSGRPWVEVVRFREAVGEGVEGRCPNWVEAGVFPRSGAEGAEGVEGVEDRPPPGCADRCPGHCVCIGYTWPSPRLVRNFFPTWISRAAFTARSTLSRRSGFRKGRRA